MAGYVIVDVEVQNPEAYETYRKQVLPTLEPHGGRYLVRGGQIEPLEGEWPLSRLVVLEFPSVEQAKEWYNSPEYQRILPIREQNARSRMILVQGV